MSNPGVKILSKVAFLKGTIKKFQVEDNIGESIHLHIDNMRVDLSIKDFLKLSDEIDSLMQSIENVEKYELAKLDKHFYHSFSEFTHKLKNKTTRKVPINSLKCLVHNNDRFGLNSYKALPVEDCPAYLYLNKQSNDYHDYSQFNYEGSDNVNRLDEILNSIKIKGYPFQDNRVVTFNSQPYIRDGQHRLCVLAYLYGSDYEVQIDNYDFSTDKVNISPLKDLLKYKIRYCYLFIRRGLGRVVRRYISI